MTAATGSRATWTSRPAFLLATIGGAVGLGNLWRFPFITGENGGGGFVLIYLGFVLLLALPELAGEMLLGRRGHKSPINAINDIVRSENASPAWKWIGWGSLLVAFIALTYYPVVAAWSIDYLAMAALDEFSGFDAAASQEAFASRIERWVFQAFLYATFVAAVAWAIARGVNRGIERLSKILMPSLFAMILLLVGYGVVAGDFAGAVEFLFAPDFSAITWRSALIALGQALFSVGVGAGLMITYASYMPREFSVRESATVICLGDTLVALLAGLAIFPIVFANGLDAAEGPGLIFVTLPVAFGNMPGGHFFGTVFFVLLLFAAYTSALGMLEPTISWLEEKFPGRRRQVTWWTGATTWLLGLGSVLSFSRLSGFHPLGFAGIELNIFGLADFTVANLILPFNALMIAAFCGWGLSRATADQELAETSPGWRRYWRITNRYVAPIAIGIVLIDLLR
ncbi:MAG: sodium-dependent transporter [Woeseiaceae bacterium]|nr:sodium-dependent transporter [Woeseiaceae bacterium]